ncbi:hypothetical protein F5Y19DRAFT_479860 [Xylariaceae sp. FL1651]|nr:hypothetical protein F5Y19DRAFT_479860 [Xylariaceae sp. FL1651]
MQPTFSRSGTTNLRKLSLEPGSDQSKGVVGLFLSATVGAPVLATLVPLMSARMSSGRTVTPFVEIAFYGNASRRQPTSAVFTQPCACMCGVHENDALDGPARQIVMGQLDSAFRATSGTTNRRATSPPALQVDLLESSLMLGATRFFSATSWVLEDIPNSIQAGNVVSTSRD